MSCQRLLSLAVSTLLFSFGIAAAAAPPVAQTESGRLAGARSTDGRVTAFKGIPYAQPPVGDLRWRPPEPPASWQGTRQATDFGPRCMQGRIFHDMKFRDSGPSEDCLSLNVWTPANSPGARLPVMVWIFGGGFQAGATSEPRQDGTNLAKKGVVVVSMNYRLGIFGFFSHPALAAESPHHASGNYGLLDQAAALEWVHKNIAAFGGDPGNVTIFGESAGSISVSAQMASPRSEGLFERAIGESGSMFMLGPTHPQTLSATEQTGAQFAERLHSSTLASLRKTPADKLLAAALADKTTRFWPNIDGWFFPQAPSAIYAAGRQAQVALLAGWNTDEQSSQEFLGREEPTPENYAAKVHAAYGAQADAILKAFPGDNAEQVKMSARDLAGDRFIAFSTWKWLEMQLNTGKAPVYRYHFEQAPPQPAGEPTHGAYHSADIEYVFETLDSKHLPWTEEDRKLSDTISSYWSNFAKTGDPNSSGLPHWPPYASADNFQLMHLVERGSESPHAAPDSLRARYQLLDNIANAAGDPPPHDLRGILLEQLRSTHTEAQWFVPVSVALDGLTPQQASWTDGKGNHSIGQLANHLAFWNRRELRKFTGQKETPYNGNNDETFNDFDAANWSATVARLNEVMNSLEEYVQNADEAQLRQYASDLAHIGTHNAYHTGQIIYIRKLQGCWDPNKGVK